MTEALGPAPRETGGSAVDRRHPRLPAGPPAAARRPPAVRARPGRAPGRGPQRRARSAGHAGHAARRRVAAQLGHLPAPRRAREQLRGAGDAHRPGRRRPRRPRWPRRWRCARHLESLAAGLACQRRTDADLAPARGHPAPYRRAAARGGNIAQADTDFHIALVDATHNSVLVRVLNAFYRFTARRREVLFEDRAQAQASVREHHRLLEHLRPRRRQGAALILRHMDRARSYWSTRARRLTDPIPATSTRAPRGNYHVHPAPVRSARCAAAACAGAGRAAPGAHSPFRSKPIRIIVPYAAGGSTDQLARAIQQPMSEIAGPAGDRREQGRRRRHDRHRLRRQGRARRLHAGVRQHRAERGGRADAQGSLRPAQGPAADLHRRADADDPRGARPTARRRTSRNSSPMRRSKAARSTSARSATARCRT